MIFWVVNICAWAASFHRHRRRIFLVISKTVWTLCEISFQQMHELGSTKVKISTQTPTEPGAGAGMEWIENRRAALERFLCRIAQHPVLCVDPDFINFLQSDEDLPRAVNTATLSGAGVMRLFNRFGETVNKITYKMDENDPVNDIVQLSGSKPFIYIFISSRSGSKIKSMKSIAWIITFKNCMVQSKRLSCTERNCPL